MPELPGLNKVTIKGQPFQPESPIRFSRCPLMLSVCDLVKVTHSLEKSNKGYISPEQNLGNIHLESGGHVRKAVLGLKETRMREIYPDRTILQKMHTPLCSQQHNPQQPRPRRHPRCPQNDEWIRRGAYIQRRILPSHKTEREKVPFASAWMDLEIVVPRSRAEKTDIIRYHPLVKYDAMNLPSKRNRLTDIKNTLVVASGEGVKATDREFGISRYKAGHIESG